jgi:hypothetical protein
MTQRVRISEGVILGDNINLVDNITGIEGEAFDMGQGRG